MEQIVEGDYIEHWENGVGRIIKIGELSTTVNFKKFGQIEVPKEKTESFNKLNPAGLFAQFYENPERIGNLIKQESTEIIRLLIYDEDKAHGRKIERSRIKSLLTKAKTTALGWRREVEFVDESKWSKWWTNVNKKLKKDPSFDTSLKSYIMLRENLVSEAQNIYDRFLTESKLDRKLSICEELIKICDKDRDQYILREVEEFIDELLSNSQAETFCNAVFNAIQLNIKGIDTESFHDNAYILSLRALLRNGVSSQKLLSIYSFLSRLESQNINDHLVIFLHSDKKLRKSVIKNFEGKKWVEKAVKEKDCREPLTGEQIAAMKALCALKKESLYDELNDLAKSFQVGIYDDQTITIGKRCVTNFLGCLLISENVHAEIKEAVMSIVMDSQIKSVVYAYLNKVQMPEITEISRFSSLFNIIGLENAEMALLNELTAKERPNVFYIAVDVFLKHNSSNVDKQQMIIAKVDEILSNLTIGEATALRLKIGRISNSVSEGNKLGDQFENKDLVKLANTRLLPLNQRIGAIDLLIERGQRDECLSIVRSLKDGIINDDFILFERIFKVFPDDKLTKEVFGITLYRIDASGGSLLSPFTAFLRNAELIEFFVEYVLTEQDDAWHNEHYEAILNLMGDDKLGRGIINIGLKKIVLNPEVPINILERFYTYSSKFIKLVIEEMKDIYIKSQLKSKDEIEKGNKKYADQIEAMIHANDAQVLEAIDKTSQRYEEYLKRLLPVLNDLEALISMIGASTADKNKASTKKDMANKLMVIKENIEGLLRIAGVMECE